MDIKFLGGTNPSRSSADDTQETINWYPEITEEVVPNLDEEDGHRVILLPTPGLKPFLSVGSSPRPSREFAGFSRLYTLLGRLWGISGNRVYSSTDLTSWALEYSASVPLNCVDRDPIGRYLLIGGDSGVLVVYDAVTNTFTEKNLGADQNIVGIANTYDDDDEHLDNFISVATAVGKIYTSTDFATFGSWTLQVDGIIDLVDLIKEIDGCGVPLRFVAAGRFNNTTYFLKGTAADEWEVETETVAARVNITSLSCIGNGVAFSALEGAGRAIFYISETPSLLFFFVTSQPLYGVYETDIVGGSYVFVGGSGAIYQGELSTLTAANSGTTQILKSCVLYAGEITISGAGEDITSSIGGDPTNWDTDVATPRNSATSVLTTEADPVEGGTITGAGSYNYGESVVLTAAPESGYGFDSWGLYDPLSETWTWFSVATTPLTVRLTWNRTMGAKFSV